MSGLGHPEEGAVAILVALMLGGGLLIGLLVFVADAGTLMVERRTQQNAADAASMALAQRCAERADDCTDAKAVNFSWRFAKSNSPDNLSTIISVCSGGSLQTPLSTKCSPPISNSPLDCRAAASSVDRYARVVTGTSLSSGTLISPLVYQIRGGSGGYSLKGCSQTAWGKAAGAPVVLPVSLPLDSFVDKSGVSLFELTTGGGQYYCPTSTIPSCPTIETIDGVFSIVSLPKGFGFINVGTPATSCTQQFRVGEYIARVTTPSKLCDQSVFGRMLGVPTFVPAMSQVTDTGNGNWQFRIVAFFRFTLLGYKITGIGQGGTVPPAGCSASTACIYGNFGRGVVPGERISTDPTIPNVGAQAVELIP